MNQADIIRMAEEAGLDMKYLYSIEGDVDNLHSFAELVAASEREACAKLCDEFYNALNHKDEWLKRVSEAIRQRGEQA